jgi:hypothetical protein
MNIFAKTGMAACVAALVLSGCGPNPTQPDRAVVLKNNYTSLANSLMAQFAQFRGKPFKRNITVAVYTEDEYRQMLGDQVNGMSAEQKKAYNAMWVRENLLHPNQDYFAGYDSMMASMTGGFYVNGSDSINVITGNNATAITGMDSTTIFHELVHAMQDQYYDLTALQSNLRSTDQSTALRYVVEGEAELFTMYYSYKQYYGSFPSSPDPIVSQFNYYQTLVDQDLDSLHQSGEPLIRQQPMLWAYYSYGPLFINAVSQGSWSAIDNQVFNSLPIKSAEVVFPAEYLTDRKEYLLDIDGFMDLLDSTQVVMDFDELGYVTTCVMFHEWDFSDYRQIAQGLLADNIIVYRGTADDSLRLIWYTRWKDAASSFGFRSAYAQLLKMKRDVTLPSAVVDGTTYVTNDTINKIYIEQTDSTVIVMEDYLPQYFDSWVGKLQSTKSYLRTAVATKRAAAGKNYPRVDKDPLMKGKNRRYIF